MKYNYNFFSIVENEIHHFNVYKLFFLFYISLLFLCNLSGEKEVLTEGKMLLMACESNSFLSYGLQSRKKVTLSLRLDLVTSLFSLFQDVLCYVSGSE